MSFAPRGRGPYALYQRLLRPSGQVRHWDRDTGNSRRVLAQGALLLAGVWLALTIVHEIAAVAAAWLLTGLTQWDLLQRAVALGPGDDLHAQLALRFIGELRVTHLAVRTPGDDILPAVAPWLFAPASTLPKDAWIGAVFAAGSSAVGVHVTQLAVNTAFVVLGTLATAAVARQRKLAEVQRWSRRELAGFGCGLLAQAYGMAGLLHMAWLDASGGHVMVTMIATKVLGIHTATYDLLVTQAGPFFSLALNLGAVALSTALALQLRRLFRLFPLSSDAAGQSSRSRLLVLPCRMPGPLTLALAIGLFQTPLKGMSVFESAGDPPPLTVAHALPASRDPAPSQALRSRTPHKVTIERTPRGFAYRVDGVRKWVRGIGYNAITLPWHTDEDGGAQRGAILERDFALIRASGANTIVGWDQQEFNDLMLHKAEQFGLGVIMPFELHASWDYGDAFVTDRIIKELRIWIARYRDYPAVRMWGLGNETIHGIGDPAGPQAHAFALFLIRAADYVHQLDPNHPVIYRDAEDQYLAPVAKSLAQDGISRPWFVYGMNFFTYRVGPALKEGPTSQLHQPLLISEFAPGGLRPADRPVGYRKLWRLLRAYPERVLGGCAYVWSTRGPEPLDRSFGLVDETGAPVDGSYDALAAAFREETGWGE